MGDTRQQQSRRIISPPGFHKWSCRKICLAGGAAKCPSSEPLGVESIVITRLDCLRITGGRDCDIPHPDDKLSGESVAKLSGEYTKKTVTNTDIGAEKASALYGRKRILRSRQKPSAHKPDEAKCTVKCDESPQTAYC